MVRTGGSIQDELVRYIFRWIPVWVTDRSSRSDNCDIIGSGQYESEETFDKSRMEDGSASGSNRCSKQSMVGYDHQYDCGHVGCCSGSNLLQITDMLQITATDESLENTSLLQMLQINVTSL